MAERVLIDTNVPMFAGGRDHAFRAACQRLMLDVATGTVNAVTDAEVLQEILHRFLATGEREKGLRIFDHFLTVMAGRVLPVSEADVRLARALAAEHPDLPARDLVHVAVMRNNGVTRIASVDAHFDAVGGITRLIPA